MAGLWKRVVALLGKDTVRPEVAAPHANTDHQPVTSWDEGYAARVRAYVEHIGKLPDDLLKLGHLVGTWPGGGLHAIRANKLSEDAWVYTTFGLTNTDMPTKVASSDLVAGQDPLGRLDRASATLQSRSGVDAPAGRAGYGYELMVLAHEDAEWPLWVLQWVAQAELLHDAGILQRVHDYDGLTVENIQVGAQDHVHLLIAHAQDVLPTAIELPHGRMEWLIATVITDTEMQWSKEHGRRALLERLAAAGTGQFSARDRASVVEPPAPPDFSDVSSRQQLEELAAEGLLEKVLLFPPELGGDDVPANTCFVSTAARKAKQKIDHDVVELLRTGHVNRYTASPAYRGQSFVPATIAIKAWSDGQPPALELIVDVW
ncbi:suppressor of fused domain protein [Dyella sp.]|uniref:suppressor of fused domain protein n=1 Tax=Dyella sp. TaxID=1869338 RepID=UPI002ED4734D